MAENLQKEAQESVQVRQNVAEIMELLRVSANLLDEVGLTKQADVITYLMEKTADAATSGLTSEKMVENLKEKGWVFNADDKEMSDLDEYLKPEPELEVEIDTGNCWDERFASIK